MGEGVQNVGLRFVISELNWAFHWGVGWVGVVYHFWPWANFHFQREESKTVRFITKYTSISEYVQVREFWLFLKLKVHFFKSIFVITSNHDKMLWHLLISFFFFSEVQPLFRKPTDVVLCKNSKCRRGESLCRRITWAVSICTFCCYKWVLHCELSPIIFIWLKLDINIKTLGWIIKWW